ncbi:nicotinate-nucleotide--dimethylbenzimidazole phosphoribosyltransferase [Deinococcus humi]|uniref:NaMN:DMB phosphoribosyltransferase n=1 Tax=Deinococcus humi TaxID=662880 RepID=A0A7W8NFM6_9DEIO|nr:nicotinate-nucleotide--dimethylbenzimidazole phosphoribosyltransferase [Deinococcus humi]MBB5363885.1 NaMN:DMB phosphoribosyltransferase [Deinococcus humi]
MTKPTGALSDLEELAARLAGIFNSDASLHCP